MNRIPHIVILGAGYGGLLTALHLRKELKRGEAKVTLVNKHDYHTLTTQLHKPAAGTDSANNARVPLEGLLRSPDIKLRKDTVQAIDPGRKTITLVHNQDVLNYDLLVIALGGEPETFGIPGLREHAMSIRSLNSVRFICQHIRYMFARYKVKPQCPECLTVVVGGSGFTGTEFVGELADRLPALCREFDVPPELVRIYNIEAAPTPLPPGLPDRLTQYGQEALTRKGVRYRIGTAIQSCEEGAVTLSNGETIRAGTVIWAGGVRGNRVVEEAGFPTKRGRVPVDASLRTSSYPDVYIIGDCSLILSPTGRPYGPTAQMAVQQGKYAADHIVATLRKRRMAPFVYREKGIVASLGKGAGVGLIAGRPLQGRIAAILKWLIDARYLWSIGGLPLVIRTMVLTTK